jgi:hypothetical protein
MMSADELRSEIKRVKGIIKATQSPFLRRDMEKYLKRLEKQKRYGIAPKTERA